MELSRTVLHTPGERKREKEREREESDPTATSKLKNVKKVRRAEFRIDADVSGKTLLGSLHDAPCKLYMCGIHVLRGTSERYPNDRTKKTFAKQQANHNREQRAGTTTP